MKTFLLIAMSSLIVLILFAIIIGKGIKKLQNEPKETPLIPIEDYLD